MAKKEVIEPVETQEPVNIIEKCVVEENPQEQVDEIERQLDEAIAIVSAPNPRCGQDMIHTGLAALCLKGSREAERRGLHLKEATVCLIYDDEEGDLYHAGMRIGRVDN